MEPCLIMAIRDAEKRRRYVAEKFEKRDSEWRAMLTGEQYRVTRQGGTEPAFTGQYYDHKGLGTYHCVCCGTPLFRSTEKYDSGSGWPSFWAPVADDMVARRPDTSHGMRRIEVRCERCGAHLGHVFNDGPPPTGQRYCINSAALQFHAQTDDDPAGSKGED